MLALFLSAITAFAQDTRPTLSISGLVNNPATYSVDELAKMQSVTVRINDIKKNGSFHGVFYTQGVPLKNLLETAVVEKRGAAFNKPLDLAILVRDKDGNKVALSWGEVFYRNPADVTIAFSTTPVMPHKTDCSGCHSADFSKPVMDQLGRKVNLPKLVVANDFDADRSLEGVTSIEVVDLGPKDAAKKKGELFSSRLLISETGKDAVMVADLSPLPNTSVSMNIVGDGRGFHGRAVYGGVPLKELLSAAGIEPDLSSVVAVSAPDGYRSLVSWGELALSPMGQRIIVADEVGGNPITKEGKFMLILPDDLAADREVKAVSKIEVYSLKEQVTNQHTSNTLK
jgi:hypothetical protein